MESRRRIETCDRANNVILGADLPALVKKKEMNFTTI